MTDLMELASRVEAGEGPDRNLDALIASLQGLRVVEEGHPLGRCCYDADNSVVRLPAYTASLDAAMTLVPEGWGWTVGDKSPEPSLAWCEIDHLPWHEGYGWAVERKLIIHASTPALALTAAALRACAHQGAAHVDQ